MTLRTIWILSCAFAVLLPAATIIAQPDPADPRRLVQRYDFEETNDAGVKIARGIALPPGWYATGRDPLSNDPNFLRVPLHAGLAGRPGFPHHNIVRYSAEGDGVPSPATPVTPSSGDVVHGDASGGGFSLHLGLDGGNAGAYLAMGSIPVVPGGDYLVTARVRTAKLQHAGARLRGYFLDREGRIIDGSVQQSPRLVSNDGWTRVDLNLAGDFPLAACLGLEVELVQPTDSGQGPLGEHQLVLQDVRGDAWFDNVAVWQLPFVQVASQSAVNVVRGGDGPSGAAGRPRLDVTVRDVVGSRLTVDLRTFDHTLREVAAERRALADTGPTRWTWTPDLPGYGWYLTELTVWEGGATAGANGVAALAGVTGSGASARPIARTVNAVLWLPPGMGEGAGADAERFAVVAEGASDATLALLPELMGKVGLGTAVLSAWTPSTTRGTLDLRVRTLGGAVDALSAAGCGVQLSLSPLPEELAATQAQSTLRGLSVLAVDPSRWLPYLQPLTVALGQRVTGWQLGSASQPDAAGRADLPLVADTVHDALVHRVGRPEVVLPWRLDQPRRGGLGETVRYEMAWPSGFAPDALAEQLAAAGWPAPGSVAPGSAAPGSDAPGSAAPGSDAPAVAPASPPPLRLHVIPDPADAVGHAARVADLAQRMIYAWEAGALGTALTNPWTPAPGVADTAGRRDALLPDPLLGVAANVAHHLAGFRAVGRLNLTHGRTALIFQHQRDPGAGLLVAFAGDTPPGHRRLRMFLGDRPVARDVWGNAAPLTPVDGEHQLDLTDTPTFITGIDPTLARFRGGFTLDRPFVTSTQTPHARTLRVGNPWPITITGRLTITGPDGWTVRPFTHSFAIAPGDTLELPVDLRFPIHETAGDKSLTAAFDFTADRAYRVNLSTPLTLGLEGVRFEPSLALEPAGATGTVDAVVTCIVTNTGLRDLSLSAAASLPGHARVERLIPRLGPGQSVLRTFRINDAADALTRHDIQTTLRETNGPAVLNQRIGVNDLE